MGSLVLFVFLHRLGADGVGLEAHSIVLHARLTDVLDDSLEIAGIGTAADKQIEVASRTMDLPAPNLKEHCPNDTVSSPSS
ncbi:MAG TPA: hypothetical protein DDX19_24000 [Rhodopirellula baltica]|nr:hypothetical protein [Rhodopirellula baltica]